MGRKVHPKIFRVGQTTDWDSKWFADKKKQASLLKEDVLVRDYLRKRLDKVGLDKITIERFADKIRITVFAARPGMIIGRGGKGVEQLKKEIKEKFFQNKDNFELNIQEVKNPFLSAGVVLENIVADLEKRVPYRKAMKRAISQVQKAGAKGVKVITSGRLDGVEIARQETLSWGKVPVGTLRADIDYAQGIARTIYGVIGVKVWIYRGDVFKEKKEKDNSTTNK